MDKQDKDAKIIVKHLKEQRPADKGNIQGSLQKIKRRIFQKPKASQGLSGRA